MEELIYELKNLVPANWKCSVKIENDIALFSANLLINSEEWDNFKQNVRKRFEDYDCEFSLNNFEDISFAVKIVPSRRQVVQSINFPRMVIHIDLAGSNSLVGGLTKEFIAKDYMKHIGLLDPTEIVFTIKRVHKELNLYEEINKVRDLLKIPENKITVFIL